MVVCGQGPQPPSPMVVERFQQVISQLFQQVRLSGIHLRDDLAYSHVSDGGMLMDLNLFMC